MLKINASALDYAIIAIYFVVVLGIGFGARRLIKDDADFFLSGRSLPAWVTGLAFVSANLGALEILGMAANGATYGVAIVHFYWIGAVPAMIFLALVMMPFYYVSKVRSVPEYLKRRFDWKPHIVNASTFAIGTVLISGVNLFALGLVLSAMLGWSITVAIIVAAAIVLTYITLGGLTSAIYNEVLQFFIIVAALLPLTIVGLIDVGGIHGLAHKLSASTLGEAGTHAWKGLGVGGVTNPIGANWIQLTFGLGFVLSFGYWTTNFAEVQRTLSARNLSAARRTPLIATYPKIFIPAIVVVPGFIALVTVKGLGGKNPDLAPNNAIPLLIEKYLPNGMIGLAITGLLAAFMAGVAANVSAFNTVVTYDIYQAYIRRDASSAHYVTFGRLATVGGIGISILTAFIAKGYSNIMDYIQLLFSYFNAPLFATFLCAMFWKRTTAWGAATGLVAGTIGAATTHILVSKGTIDPGSPQAADMTGAAVAFLVDIAVTVVVTLFTRPEPEEKLGGLVHGLVDTDAVIAETERDQVWWRSPALLAGGAIVLIVVLNILFI
ncbi:MAG: solute:Na+ symporter, family [Thermoleophilaceae bacterium]|nr:solute:Na+ symporter, family [Thermoleophilaceae bacterium]